MSRAAAHVGTSGWMYRDWREAFYPADMRQADWLGYYAQRFGTVEVNNSFYKLPKPDMVDAWAASVPSNFRFALKLWRGITQYRKLKDCREFLERFFALAERIPKPKRGPVLVQLPPNLHVNVDRLQGFLDDFRKATAPVRWKVAVEFRHPSWLTDEVYRVLDRHRAAVCLHDMSGRGATNEPNDARFVYMRRHGGTANAAGGYSSQQIAADARQIRRWRKEGRGVFVYYNNDRQANAVRDAAALQRKVEHPSSATKRRRKTTKRV